MWMRIPLEAQMPHQAEEEGLVAGAEDVGVLVELFMVCEGGAVVLGPEGGKYRTTENISGAQAGRAALG